MANSKFVKKYKGSRSLGFGSRDKAMILVTDNLTYILLE